ncbi:MAG TPA: hypothetical protein VFU43_08610 [Streptosporangiaceae bacterium]|nr:hypothetical protein [Streptosporangiaceae bacterium]
MAVLASLVTILGLFDVKIREFPSLSRRAAGGLIYLILVMNVLAGTGWGISSYHQAHRAVDVLAMITISRNIDLRPDGAPATLDAPITAQRDDIVLVFQAVDHNPEGGICTPFAEFLVTRRLSGNATAPVAAAPGRPVRVDLPRGGTNVHLEIALKDARQLRNCGVDLRVTSVKLANR